MLMNDGKGNFTMNTNFPTRPILESNQSINMWASTATIADFDGDGKIDEYFTHRQCEHVWGDLDGDGTEECLKCGKIKDENAEMHSEG